MAFSVCCCFAFFLTFIGESFSQDSKLSNNANISNFWISVILILCYRYYNAWNNERWFSRGPGNDLCVWNSDVSNCRHQQNSTANNFHWSAKPWLRVLIRNLYLIKIYQFTTLQCHFWLLTNLMMIFVSFAKLKSTCHTLLSPWLCWLDVWGTTTSAELNFFYKRKQKKVWFLFWE